MGSVTRHDYVVAFCPALMLHGHDYVTFCYLAAWSNMAGLLAAGCAIAFLLGTQCMDQPCLAKHTQQRTGMGRQFW